MSIDIHKGDQAVIRAGKGFSEQGIRGVLIPAGQRYILLPNAAVAEIIVFKNPTPSPGAPAWLLGRLDWRGLNIPIISWERLVEGLQPNWGEQRIRIAVLNTLNGNPAVTHIGLLSVGLTRLTRIRADILHEDKTSTLSSNLIKASVSITGLPAWIPDLDELERKILTIQ